MSSKRMSSSRVNPFRRWMPAVGMGAGLLLGGCPPQTGPEPDPAEAVFSLENKRQALGALLIAPGWGAPEIVTGGAQSIGWEDSAYVSRDGRTLSFMYLAADVLVWDAQTNLDPARFDDFRRGPDHGNDPPHTVRFYTTQIAADGTTSEPIPFPFAKPGRGECCGMLAGNGDWYYSATPPLPAYDLDIYRNDERLAFNTPLEEGDPHYDDATRTIYFDSGDRVGTPQPGKANIWMTQLADDGAWSTPILLAAPINRPEGDEVQPHIGPDGQLYFSSDREGGGTAIFASQRLGDNIWSEPRKVVGPPLDASAASGPLSVAGVGEPTLTDAGVLYVNVLFFDRATEAFDPDIVRLPPSSSFGQSRVSDPGGR